MLVSLLSAIPCNVIIACLNCPFISIETNLKCPNKYYLVNGPSLFIRENSLRTLQWGLTFLTFKNRIHSKTEHFKILFLNGSVFKWWVP